jgi:hypothetical protein
MSVRGLMLAVLVAALLAGLARCLLVASRPDTFAACWLGLGWLTWRWGDGGPPDGDCPYVLLGWPLVWVVALVLMVACLVDDLFDESVEDSTP